MTKPKRVSAYAIALAAFQERYNTMSDNLLKQYDECRSEEENAQCREIGTALDNWGMEEKALITEWYSGN